MSVLKCVAKLERNTQHSPSVPPPSHAAAWSGHRATSTSLRRCCSDHHASVSFGLCYDRACPCDQGSRRPGNCSTAIQTKATHELSRRALYPATPYLLIRIHPRVVFFLEVFCPHGTPRVGDIVAHKPCAVERRLYAVVLVDVAGYCESWWVTNCIWSQDVNLLGITIAVEA
jgi:hypothetical protein